MNTMNTLHEPDPEFARHLEWQLRTELRRQMAFNESDSPAKEGVRRFAGRFARAAALVVVSLTLGGAGVLAAEHYQDQAHRELVEARARVRLDLAHRRNEFLAEALREAEVHVAGGVASERELLEARARLSAEHFETQRLELDLAEVQVSGVEPRNEISALLVGGRDYVSARLDLTARETSEELEQARRELDRGSSLVEAGVVSRDFTRGLEAEVLGSEAALDLAHRQLGLRASHLAGEITAWEADLRAAEARVNAQLERLRAELVGEQVVLERIEMLSQGGVVSGSEAKAVRLRVEELEAAVSISELELRFLRVELGG